MTEGPLVAGAILFSIVYVVVKVIDALVEGTFGGEE